MEREDRGGGDEFGGRYNYIGLIQLLIRDDLSSRYGLGSSAQRLLVSSAGGLAVLGRWSFKLAPPTPHAPRWLSVRARVGVGTACACPCARARRAARTYGTYARWVLGPGAGLRPCGVRGLRRSDMALGGLGHGSGGGWLGGLARSALR